MCKALLFLPLCLCAALPLDAVTLTGQVDLDQPKQRRGHLRYGGADLSELGPPAPFVGVVFLTGAGAAAPPPSQPEVMEQKGLQFYPAVLPVQVGTSVSFPNQDNTYHNVFSYSPEKRFDLGRYAKGEGPPVVTFEEPGEVRVFCEVHEHMRAIILVLDSPYFAPTDAEGRFTLTDIPAGDYSLNVWRLNQKLEQRPVTVGNEALVIEF